MKKFKFIFYLFLSLQIISCENTETKSDKESSFQNDSLFQQTTKVNLQSEQKSYLTLDSNFIGHTSKEWDSFQVCFAHIIEDKVYGTTIDFALSKISKDIENCNNGKKKVLLEKMIRREGQIAIFEATDELNFDSKKNKKIYTSYYAKLPNEKTELNYLLEHDDTQKVYLENVSRIWIINLKSQKFEEVEVPKNYKFQNPDYDE